MEDFYLLCKMILLETDLKEMDYVWVDAICVNQTNHDKRKETIYQMSTIYEKAKYILAVPDLHLSHLENTLESNRDITNYSKLHHDYIYYLIHGNIDQLALLDKEFLNLSGLPDDHDLQQLMNTFTYDFKDGFIKCLVRPHEYYEEYTLEHIVRNIPIKEQVEEEDIWTGKTKSHLDDDKQGLERLHHCHEEECPLDPDHTLTKCSEIPCTIPILKKNKNCQQKIQERSIAIERSMEFMMDLIKDWSTRVWVISEYNIAKKKNNLKFWFIQLHLPYGKNAFFKFDFMDSTFYTKIENDLTAFRDRSSLYRNNSAYHYFHETVSSQLNQQSFLEMMLKSKASKNGKNPIYLFFLKKMYMFF
jgi:hypothetical protein